MRTVGDFVRLHALQQMLKGNLLSRYSKLFKPNAE